MKSNTLVIYKTHVINTHVLEEYKKIAQSGYSTILVVDNRENVFPDLGSQQGWVRWHGIDIHYFLTDEDSYRSINLPFISHSGPDNDLGRILWTNSDYTIYLMRKNYKKYRYFWQFDYDCYYNAQDYASFFEQYASRTEDLIIPHFNVCTNNWFWLYKTDWIYKDVMKYRSLFPIIRLSSRAADFLYDRRIIHGEIYNNKLKEQMADIRIIFSELFVPTELMNNGYICSALANAKHIGWRPNHNDIFYKERRYLNYDHIMYHPIKNYGFYDYLTDKVLTRENFMSRLKSALLDDTRFSIYSLIVDKNKYFIQIPFSADGNIHYEFLYCGNRIEVSLHFERTYEPIKDSYVNQILLKSNSLLTLSVKDGHYGGCYYSIFVASICSKDTISELLDAMHYLIYISWDILSDIPDKHRNFTGVQTAK